VTSNITPCVMFRWWYTTFCKQLFQL